jgi:hypothetical protein
MEAEPEFLGMRAAGKRVHRSRRTIRRWMAAGMPYKMLDGRKYILLDDLLSTYRTKLLANPTRRKRTDI